MEETQQPLINPSLETINDPIKKIKITETDKENFFKSVLSDSPYEEAISLFDGQIKARFRNMTVQENTDVVNQIVQDRENGTASETDAYFITMSAYRMSVCLLTIDDKPYSTITKDNYSVEEDGNTYVFARTKPMLSWSTSKLAVFIDAFRAFEAKVLKLTTEVQSPNFWKASA